MALTATIFKVNLQIADMDRNYFAVHPLTLARHPSETDVRMMVRLLAYALNADEALSFTKGLCVDEEPDLWQKGATGEIALWIDVGLPDEKRIRKACNRSAKVSLFLYGGRGVEPWWQKNAEKLQRFTNLLVFEVPDTSCRDLTDLVQRNMQLQCTIQDGNVWLSSGEQTCSIALKTRMAPV